MVALSLYLFLSLVVPVVFVLDYAYAYREYFTTVVELTNSPVFRLLCINGFIMVVVLIWIIARHMFFGSLNPSEKEVVRRTIPLYIVECIGAPLYAGVSPFSFIAALALLTAVFGALHRVARERTITLHVVGTRAERMRMLGGLALFFFVAMPFDLYFVFDAFVNHARQEDGYLTLQYCAGIMYLQFAVSNLRLVLRLFFTEVIGESTHGGLAFYVEVMFSLIRSSIFFLSFTYVCFVSEAPYSLIRMLFNHILAFFRKLIVLVRYISLTRLLNKIPNAPEDVLARDSHCVICYDDMMPEQNCKQLPCGHCYHELCLRRWFETMSTCPYCRADLMRKMREATTTQLRANIGTLERNDNNNNNENNATVMPSFSPPPPPTTTTTTSTIERTEERGVSYEPVSNRWEPLNEIEIQQEYARYCDAMLRNQKQQKQQKQQQQLTSPTFESKDELRTDVVLQEISDTFLEFQKEPVTATVLGDSVVNGDKGQGSSDMTGSDGVYMNTQLSRKDLQRLEAYRAYEASIRAATETLQRRLRVIDLSL